MSIIKANGIDIKIEEYGPKNGPAILLICGWSTQLTFWPKDFIERLCEAGFRVIAFDNRDVGHSQKFDSHLTTYPLAPHIMASRLLRTKVFLAYTLEDMANDAIGILDTLDIRRAHFLGVSMGGMITQILTSKFPERVISSTILMSSSNRFGLPGPPPLLALELLFRRARNDRRGSLKRSQRIWRKIRTQDGGYSENELENSLNSTIDRSFYPAGRRRQLEAVMATGDLRRFLRKIVSPTLVLHGSADILSRPHGGIDIAENIRGAKFELIDGLGHDLAPNKIEEISDLVIQHAREAQKAQKRIERVA